MKHSLKEVETVNKMEQHYCLYQERVCDAAKRAGTIPAFFFLEDHLGGPTSNALSTNLALKSSYAYYLLITSSP